MREYLRGVDDELNVCNQQLDEFRRKNLEWDDFWTKSIKAQNELREGSDPSSYQNAQRI